MGNFYDKKMKSKKRLNIVIVLLVLIIPLIVSSCEWRGNPQFMKLGGGGGGGSSPVIMKGMGSSCQATNPAYCAEEPQEGSHFQVYCTDWGHIDGILNYMDYCGQDELCYMDPDSCEWYADHWGIGCFCLGDGECTTGAGENEHNSPDCIVDEICDDGINNDGDGLIDCADTDDCPDVGLEWADGSKLFGHSISMSNSGPRSCVWDIDVDHSGDSDYIWAYDKCYSVVRKLYPNGGIVPGYEFDVSEHFEDGWRESYGLAVDDTYFYLTYNGPEGELIFKFDKTTGERMVEEDIDLTYTQGFNINAFRGIDYAYSTDELWGTSSDTCTVFCVKPDTGDICGHFRTASVEDCGPPGEIFHPIGLAVYEDNLIVQMHFPDDLHPDARRLHAYNRMGTYKGWLFEPLCVDCFRGIDYRPSLGALLYKELDEGSYYLVEDSRDCSDGFDNDCDETTDDDDGDCWAGGSPIMIKQFMVGI